MYGEEGSAPPPKKKTGKIYKLLHELSSDEDEDGYGDEGVDTQSPWLKEFNLYINSPTSVATEMSIIEWWGVSDSSQVLKCVTKLFQLNAELYPVWASLAHDYLSTMASSVSSECAFSAAALTITKHHNHLNGDIVEAIQVLCMLCHNELLFRECGPSSALELELEDEDEGGKGDVYTKENLDWILELTEDEVI
jgi:hypothetical protein